ncbi:MAG: metal ABC transporter permease [Clostridia bacterium]|nr:metal ABC transporter permease [Clostridia bacterium]
MTVIEAFLHYRFMQNALVAALLCGVLCGLIGVIIVEKRLVMMSGGIAHTAYGGVGLGYLFGFSPLLGAVLFSLAAAFGIGTLRRRGGARTDVLISLFWSLGMAAGIVFVALAPGYPPDLNSYLFGNILTVTSGDLWLMLGVTALVVLLLLALFEDLRSYLFDETFAAVSGLRVRLLEWLVLGLIALTVVVLLRVTGIMLAIALLTAPAATAAMLTRRLFPRMLTAAGLSAGFSVAGLVLSFYFNIPSGATVVALAVLTYATVLGVRTLRRRRTA